jgi:hypothetical protein
MDPVPGTGRYPAPESGSADAAIDSAWRLLRLPSIRNGFSEHRRPGDEGP